MLTFKEFLNNYMIVENLHPDLKAIIENPGMSTKNKHKQVVQIIKDLSASGKKTGIEGNMPKGSSRAYLKHEEPHQAVVDGKKATFRVGTKIAINAPLNTHHNKAAYDGKSLGQLQNDVENNDHFANRHYRVLTKNDDGSYETNHDSDIFPPLVDHDHKEGHWATVGHSRDIKAGEFKKLTRTETHPEGISHQDFMSALNRAYHKDNGKHWNLHDEREKEIDHIESHPLVQKFLDHQRNFGSSPMDYQQKKNMGIFEHPHGHKFIVARDHGYSNDVHEAYTHARMKKYGHRW